MVFHGVAVGERNRGFIFWPGADAFADKEAGAQQCHAYCRGGRIRVELRGLRSTRSEQFCERLARPQSRVCFERKRIVENDVRRRSGGEQGEEIAVTEFPFQAARAMAPTA